MSTIDNLAINYNNSAGRLLAILEHLGEDPKGSRAYVEIFPRVFVKDESGSSFDKSEKLEITYDIIHELQALYYKVVNDIENSSMPDAQKSVVLNGITDVRKTINPEQIVGTNFIPIGAAAKSFLEVFAAGIPMLQDVDEEDLELLRQSIEDLRKQLSKSGLDETLKNILLELIRISRDSIDFYEIRGPEGLKNAFKSMMAELYEVHFADKTVEEKEEIMTSEPWKAMMGHLGKFDSITSKLIKYKPILEGATQALPLLLG
jgi:hypothetical protein